YSEELHDGAIVIAKAVGAKEVILAIESDQAHAIAEMRRVFTKKSGIRLSVVHTKYPQGSERQLISSLLGREVPPEGTGADVGVLCVNVSTAVALSRAVREGKPLYERVVTVSGSAVANPKNLLVKIGTPIEELFDACGGFLEHPDRIIAGGPMMGHSQFSLDAPVQKGTNAVLAFCRGEDKNEPESVCIRCGKCVDACPMNLMPLYIYRAYKAGRLSDCEEQNVSDCTECGCCAYVCPARISLVSAICAAKQKILAAKKEERQ
ncbi:MAG: RnfABCDGE type electron transport complex subunit C, partial [Oscillospiraceae bacterium]|nr:RnfABCDGE type electron transport complex subunit C [Oscillospiraceae bacterium]